LLPALHGRKTLNPGGDNAAMQSPLIILMTATVAPGAYADQILRSGIDVRLQDYLSAMRFWAAYPDPRIGGVVLCENSGTGADALQAEAARLSTPARPFEVITFEGNHKPAGVHYGYAELGSIDHACRNSRLLPTCRFFVKVTGRFRFPRLSALLDTLDNDLLVAMDCRRAYRSEGGFPLRARTQLIVFDRAFYERTLMGAREQMPGHFAHIEAFLPHLLRPLHQARMAGICLRHAVECPPEGFSAYQDTAYGRPSERIKVAIRGLGRRLLPALWW
jgi:hypothetical protein